ncbi:type II toxin-antitoxin system HicB family antitoxin [Defluviimonas sp. SAOS-178_SWC]|uniref:type II toxin-antitoxin system HicB family antitoxin n=1 Tax=Defluviimonas sp. SAOS-178_SWC TaxID=3121287 RepID=UPI0032218A6A
MNYWAIVHHDPGSAYGVSFPDVPDCFAAADEEKDIMRNAIAAIDDYFDDGHAYPEPRAVSDIVKGYAEDLAAGAFLIHVPVVRRSAKTVRANISMEQGLLEAIDEAADRLQMNRSAFLAQAARHEIERV